MTHYCAPWKADVARGTDRSYHTMMIWYFGIVPASRNERIAKHTNDEVIKSRKKSLQASVYGSNKFNLNMQSKVYTYIISFSVQQV